MNIEIMQATSNCHETAPKNYGLNLLWLLLLFDKISFALLMLQPKT